MLDEHRAQVPPAWAARVRVMIVGQVLSDWLGFDNAREQELQREGAFGL